MREIIKRQIHLGEGEIGAIAISTKSRDGISRLPRGLQHLCTTEAPREKVFSLLAEVVPQWADDSGAASVDIGRPGMSQWRLVVLGGTAPGAKCRRRANHQAGQPTKDDSANARARRLEGGTAVARADAQRQPVSVHRRLLDPINQVVVAAGHAPSRSHSRPSRSYAHGYEPPEP
jgi:hypothetical protein